MIFVINEQNESQKTNDIPILLNPLVDTKNIYIVVTYIRFE